MEATLEDQNVLNKGFYLSGIITEILDPVLYQIKVDIPGVIQGVTAFPRRGELDEPRVGDFVLLKCTDPIYHSYYLYCKIKEDDFIGIRSNGKMVDITPSHVTVGIFPIDTEYSDTSENYRPELTDWIKLDSDGNLDVFLRENSTINIQGSGKLNISGTSDVHISGNCNVSLDSNCNTKILGNSSLSVSGDCNITMESDSNTKISGDSNLSVSGNCNITMESDSNTKISGDSNLSVSGDCNIESSGDATISANTVKITGGNLEVSGKSNSSGDGPFNCISVCPFSGASHRGSKVKGT